jgi:hypothetical protein
VRTREKITIWRCGHLYPVVVETTEGGKRARCLGCHRAGPVRAGSSEAMQALRGEARYKNKVVA